MNLYGLFILAATSILPIEDGNSFQEYVHTVEINHVSGRFTQLLYRDRAGEIRDWRILNDAAMMPKPAFGKYEAMWNDQGVWRSLVIEDIYETWTEHDPEVLDRKWRPETMRVKLGARFTDEEETRDPRFDFSMERCMERLGLPNLERQNLNRQNLNEQPEVNPFITVPVNRQLNHRQHSPVENQNLEPIQVELEFPR